MKRILALGGVIGLFVIGAVGCQNAAEGAKQDTANNTAAVKDAADTAAMNTKKAADTAVATTEQAANNAAAATKKASDRMASATEKMAKNVDDNVTARPKVKDAIINDAELNNTANEVHVEVQAGVVTLSGHVLTKEMKQRAGNIASKTLKEMNSTDSIENKLTVQPAK